MEKSVDSDNSPLGKSYHQWEEDTYGQQDSNEHIEILIEMVENLPEIQLTTVNTHRLG